MPRKSRRLPVFLDDDEVVAILNATKRERNRIMLFLMRYVGFRVGDVVRTNVEDLDFRKKSIWVRGAKYGVDSCLPMPEFLVGPLRGWVGARKSGPLFPSRQGGGHMKKRAVQHMFKEAVERAGIHRHLNRATCHKLRHAFCSTLLANNVDIVAVRDLMRHNDLSSTNRYAHCSSARLKDAISKCV